MFSAAGHPRSRVQPFELKFNSLRSGLAHTLTQMNRLGNFFGLLVLKPQSEGYLVHHGRLHIEVDTIGIGNLHR